jgi:DNA polymerase I
MDIALDIETTGLHPWHPEAKTLLITIKGPDGKITSVKGSETKKIDALRPILEDPSITKIIHRSSFDCTWLAVQNNIFIKNIFDTKLAEQMIQGLGEMGETSLDQTLRKYKLAKLDKSIVKGFIGKKDEKFTVEELVYAAADVEFLHKLKAIQEKKIEEMGMTMLLKLENAVAEVTYMMRVHGIKLDVSAWLDIADEYRTRYDELELKLDKHFNNKVTEIKSKQAKIFEEVVQDRETIIHTNWGSPAQVKKHFKHLGKFSYDDIPRMKGKDEWFDVFIEMHSLSKYISTYGYSWLETERGDTVAKDGRVHCDFAQIVSTGRYSSSFPNLQNIPKDAPHRRAFVADAGNVLVSGDFTGQEIAIMAYGSGESFWLDALARGEDIHSIMAQLFFTTEWQKGKEKGCSFPKRCKCKLHSKIRNKAKTYNFGLPYGKTAPTLAYDLGITNEEAAKTVARYKTDTPSLSSWLKANGKYAIEHMASYTLEPFSRYRNLSTSHEDWHRRNQGYNTPVQGTGGDMLKLALLYAYRASKDFKTVKVILCVHDQIICECSEKEADRWSKVLAQEMMRAADFVLDEGLVAVDPAIAKNWAEL